MAVRMHAETGEPLAALSRSPLLASLDREQRARLVAQLELVELPAHGRLRADGDDDPALSFVLAGRATLCRSGIAIRRLGPGDAFGAVALVTGRPRGETIAHDGPMAIARLSAARWTALRKDDPQLAAQLAVAVAASLADELLLGAEGFLFRGRSLPRAETVAVVVGGEERRVPTGTRLVDLLPTEVGGQLVVAGLIGQKPVSLATPIMAPARIAPLTVAHFEGRRIYANSLGLLLVEAAHRVAPGLKVRMGPSLGTRQIVDVAGDGIGDRGELARRIAAAMEDLAAADVPFRVESWATDEARSWFEERGWEDAWRLLRFRRQATVRLVSCGEVYALSMGPLLPSAGRLRGFELSPRDEGLALDLGAVDPRNGVSRRTGPASPGSARRGHDMAREHQRWLSAMGVTSVGAFNELCVSGQVAQLIRVAEGFHEKRIGHIADEIAARRDQIRIIAIAGPSSSGKTTFIKRLTVQLQIDGVNPVGLSLDDYYVDRERTPRGQDGDWDFEALEALNLDLLQEHVRRLLAGELVKTARYDFLTGKSDPGGGPAIQLGPGDVLVLEGIHGLNPRLLGGIPRPGEVYRIFLHPATTLPFDRLTRVSATDLRLVRRIVRDRHQRGYRAADNILRWPSVQAGEREHIFPYQEEADAIFDTSLVYEPAVLKVYAERYLLEVPQDHPAYPTAHRLRHLVDRFVAIYPDHVPPTSLIREFIGGSGFEY